MAVVNHITPGSGTFPDYFWQGRLGSGSNGVVHSYRCIFGGEQVAIKINAATQESYEQAQAELRALQQLKDAPHVIRLEKYQQLGPLQLAIFMELVPGKNLRDYLDQGYVFKPDQLMDITRNVLFALEHLESLKIATGDLKPDNIVLCDQTNSIRLVDFGLGIFLNDFQSRPPSEYPFGYTLFYRPPEMFFSKRYNTTVDIWAFGATLAHLCLGRPLFFGGLEIAGNSIGARHNNVNVYNTMLYQYWLFCGQPPAGYLDDSAQNIFFVTDPGTNRPSRLIEDPYTDKATSYLYCPDNFLKEFSNRVCHSPETTPLVNNINRAVIQMLQWDGRPSPSTLLQNLHRK